MLQTGRSVRLPVLSASPETVRSLLAARRIHPLGLALVNGLFALALALAAGLPPGACILWWAGLLALDLLSNLQMRLRLRQGRAAWTPGASLQMVLQSVVRDVLFLAPLLYAAVSQGETGLLLAGFGLASLALVNLGAASAMPASAPVLMAPAGVGAAVLIGLPDWPAPALQSAPAALAFVLCAGLGVMVAERSARRLRARIRRQAARLARLAGERDEARALLAASRDSEARARKADDSKSSFLSTMSHEIRTPLSGVIGAVDLLKSRQLDAETANLVSVMQHSGELLLEILNDLLDLSKIDAGHLELDPRSADLRSLLSAGARAFEAKALEKGLRIFVDIDTSVPPAATLDDRRLRQILFNLVSNAIKFTDYGEVHLRAFAAPCGEGARLTVQVHDTGIGMSAQALSRIFNPFVQADAGVSRRYGGSGLGLAISQRLAHLMGGTLSVASEERVGSVFTLTVPLREPLAQAPVRASEETRIQLSGLRVLLADDNDANRNIVTAVLNSFGVDAVGVGDGRAALLALGEQKFDAVLMDVRMPEMDGLEATRQLRARPGVNRFTPVIALTANALDEHRQRCAQAGMTDFLPKPVRPADLYAALKRAAASRAPASAA
jgi:signal transduction histidine kinase/ActR/RegA family two-component response regulator